METPGSKSGSIKVWVQDLISQGILTQEQVSECLSIQKKLKDEGKPRTLDEILVYRGYLTSLQASSLRGPGINIPGFKILKILGQGGMGTVYKAWQISPPRTVALKVLSGKALDDPSNISRFFREVHAMLRLQHPNLTSGYGFAQHEGIYYLIMEYIDGVSVASIISRDGPFTEGKALEIIEPVTDALYYAWKNDFLHRDIKPSNIMITETGGVKLCDFGLVKAASTDIAATSEGVAVGTPLYMSPEQMLSCTLDFRSDVYSLSSTLYFMVAGRPPYTADNMTALYHKKIHDPPTPLKKFANISKKLNHFIIKTLSRRPSDRTSTPENFLSEIRSLLPNNKGSSRPVQSSKKENETPLWVLKPDWVIKAEDVSPDASSEISALESQFDDEHNIHVTKNTIHIYVFWALLFSLILRDLPYIFVNYLSFLAFMLLPFSRGARRFFSSIVHIYTTDILCILFSIITLSYPIVILLWPKLQILTIPLTALLFMIDIVGSIILFKRNIRKSEEYSNADLLKKTSLFLKHIFSQIVMIFK